MTSKRRAQRQRRRSKYAHRVEIVLSAANDRDRAIFDFLQTLPAGQGGEFIKRAIYRAMSGDHHEPTPDRVIRVNAKRDSLRDGDDHALADILRELAALRDVVSQHPTPTPGFALTRQDAAPPIPSDCPTEYQTAESSGIDMSRRRRTGGTPKRPPSLPEVESPPARAMDAAAALRILTSSAREYGLEYQGAR